MSILHHDKGDNSGHFKRKNVAFETTKSVALAGTLTAAAFYTLLGGFRGSVPSNRLLSESVGLGAVVGTLFGHSKYNRTKVYNNKAETLNKYQSSPEIQNDIMYNIGGVDFKYQRSRAEALLGNVNIGSFVAGFGYDAIRGGGAPNAISNFLTTTTSLSALGWIASRVFGMHKAVKEENKQLLYAEKIALERAGDSVTSQLNAR